MKLAPVNITNCDKEPIHLIDHVQPHGYQLIYSSDGKLATYSNNITALYTKKKLPLDITQLISAAHLDYLRADGRHTVQQAISIGKKSFSLYAFHGGSSI